MAVKGEGALNVRVPAAFALTVVGLAALWLLPQVVWGAVRLEWAAVAAGLVVGVPLALQGPLSLVLLTQKKPLVEFLERCGPQTEVLRSSPLTFLGYKAEVKAVVGGAEHRFWVGYRVLGFRKRPCFLMVWPTARKGISIQNKVRFNNFSAKFNTMEFTYLRNWHVRLFLYPKSDDTWWFDLYLFDGLKATQEHLWECFQIALETKEKLTRPNPAF